jgi:predicted transcriptional regulator
MGSHPMAVKLEPEIQDRLKKLAAAKRRSPHWLMKEALRGDVSPGKWRK